MLDCLFCSKTLQKSCEFHWDYVYIAHMLWLDSTQHSCFFNSSQWLQHSLCHCQSGLPWFTHSICIDADFYSHRKSKTLNHVPQSNNSGTFSLHHEPPVINHLSNSLAQYQWTSPFQRMLGCSPRAWTQWSWNWKVLSHSYTFKKLDSPMVSPKLP